jgi:hypothetical protein
MTKHDELARQILAIRLPSYHKQLDLAKQLARSQQTEQLQAGILVLEELHDRFPQVLLIGQELVLAYMEGGLPPKAEHLLFKLEQRFQNLDEETLCRWGRLFKDQGDRHVELPWPDQDKAVLDSDLAVSLYRRSLEKYDQAYQDRQGHYPGINKATLLLIVGSLKPRQADPRPREIADAEQLAGELLRNRTRWPRDYAEDDTVWHPATAGEAHLIRQEWPLAEMQYRAALASSMLTPHARRAMLRQVERILMCFRKLAIEIQAPFDDPKALFQIEKAKASAEVSPPEKTTGQATV